MSTTPRTDLQIMVGRAQGHDGYVHAAFARVVEDELNAARTDANRLDLLEKYLSDPAKNISGPTPDDPTWQFGYNGGMAYIIEGAGNTLREAIDSLPKDAK